MTTVPADKHYAPVSRELLLHFDRRIQRRGHQHAVLQACARLYVAAGGSMGVDVGPGMAFRREGWNWTP